MILKTNLNFSSNVSKGVTRSALLSINKVKSVLPLNLPRIMTKNYLMSFIASHLVFYPITNLLK